jgi:sporulation protein YlmC with PRC-barrel domain
MMGATFAGGLYAQNTSPSQGTGVNQNTLPSQNSGVNQNTLPSSSANQNALPSHASSSSTALDHEMVGRVNKASNLIGMDVKNNANEKLGDVKDLVLDLHSGKISYVVLSVGGFLGIGDRYIAVPPNAFAASADDNKLVLNADKTRIQNAPGFAKNSWPDMNASSWGANAAYWNPDTAQGTLGTAATETGRAGAIGSATSPNSTLNRTGDMTFKGKVTAVNPESNMITVEGPAGTRDFKVGEHANFTLKSSRNPHLIDFKVGYPVTIRYHDLNGSYVADDITRSDTPEVR